MNILKAFVSFQSKVEQLNGQAEKCVQKVQKRFPTQTFIGCTFFKENEIPKGIGRVGIMRVIPEMGQYLTFMDFNDVRKRARDFAVALLNTVDTHRRTKLLLRLCQNKTKGDIYYEALEESLMMTLSLEIQKGCASKHSRRFNFDDFTTFIASIKDVLAEDKSLNVLGMQELIIRLE